ncbi:MAG: hypothetical protein HY514_03805 [Candidatus Aenigmarchaeota archaeon]|nr:hypothetical protein [Candidatus Aenigmarchaeota archaeon]
MFETHRFLSSARQAGYITNRTEIFLGAGRRKAWVVENKSGEKIGVVYKNKADKPGYIARCMPIPEDLLPSIKLFCLDVGLVEPSLDRPHYRQITI